MKFIKFFGSFFRKRRNELRIANAPCQLLLVYHITSLNVVQEFSKPYQKLVGELKMH